MARDEGPDTATCPDCGDTAKARFAHSNLFECRCGLVFSRSESPDELPALLRRQAD